jgi:two-component system cell cycle sensor histidine kinase/response regulator CckA
VPAPPASGPAEAWISTLFLNMPMALALVGKDGAITAVNDALRVTCGSDAVLGNRPEALFVAEDRGAIAAAVADAVSSGQFTSVRAALGARPSDKQPISIIAAPPGDGIAAIVAVPDVREQLRLEKQVEAVTRMQAVGQLAGGVAHDFNNVLTAILALTDQLLSRHEEPGLDRDDLEQVRDNARRAAALVAQLLAFARQQPQQRRLLDLADVVNGLRPLLSQLLGSGVRLAIEAPPPRRAIRADPSQLEQIVVNLAVNARDAMGGQGVVTICVFDVGAAEVPALKQPVLPAADYVALSVRDTGTGIPKAILGKIFEPFFTTKPQGKGTGLGLSTVYGVVKQNGGYVFATSPPDGGACFTVYLPAATGDIERAAATAKPAPPPPTESLTGLKVLLVEDEPAVRAVLTRSLTRLGVDVTAASGGDEALARLAERTFDVMVSDIMMPGIDGVALAEKAKTIDPGLRVVLMSGFAQSPLRDAARAPGIEFLAKPFAAADLAAALGRVKQALPARGG